MGTDPRYRLLNVNKGFPPLEEELLGLLPNVEANNTNCVQALEELYIGYRSAQKQPEFSAYQEKYISSTLFAKLMKLLHETTTPAQYSGAMKLLTSILADIDTASPMGPIGIQTAANTLVSLALTTSDTFSRASMLKVTELAKAAAPTGGEICESTLILSAPSLLSTPHPTEPSVLVPLLQKKHRMLLLLISLVKAGVKLPNGTQFLVAAEELSTLCAGAPPIPEVPTPAPSRHSMRRPVHTAAPASTQLPPPPTQSDATTLLSKLNQGAGEFVTLLRRAGVSDPAPPPLPPAPAEPAIDPSELEKLKAELAQAIAARDAALAQRDAAVAERDAAVTARDSALSAKQTAEKEVASAKQDAHRAQQQLTAAQTEAKNAKAKAASETTARQLAQKKASEAEAALKELQENPPPPPEPPAPSPSTSPRKHARGVASLNSSLGASGSGFSDTLTVTDLIKVYIPSKSKIKHRRNTLVHLPQFGKETCVIGSPLSSGIHQLTFQVLRKIDYHPFFGIQSAFPSPAPKLSCYFRSSGHVADRTNSSVSRFEPIPDGSIVTLEINLDGIGRYRTLHIFVDGVQMPDYFCRIPETVEFCMEFYAPDESVELLSLSRVSEPSVQPIRNSSAHYF